MWFLFFLLSDLPPAESLLQQVIQAHDPKGIWEGFHYNLKIRETRPNAKDRLIEVEFNSSGSCFRYVTKEPREVVKTLEKGVCSAWLDGTEDYDSEAEA